MGRLSYNTKLSIKARDSARGYVLLSGFGGLDGCMMWHKETEYDKEMDGYDSAPEADSLGDFGGPTVGEGG